MLHKSKSKKINQLKFALVIPVLLGFLISCNSEVADINPDNLTGKDQSPSIKVLGVGNNLENDQHPLFIVDGKEVTKKEFESLDENGIFSINVLKNENFTKKYGDKGKNGVIEIITKENAKSFEGKPSNRENLIGFGAKPDSTITIRIGQKIEISKDKHPLVVIDGKELPYEKMGEQNHDTFESMSVLNAETATNKYGNKGKNGVIEITTKK